MDFSSPVLYHPPLANRGKDSEDSATLWVTLASRIVYRVMSLHTGASAPLSFLLSLDPSPSVPFHSILPRSRHCSAVPFIRNKVSSGPAQCTPVFLGSLYLFLSSARRHPLPCPPLSRNLCAIVVPPTARKIALNVADRFSFIKRRGLKRMLLLVETRSANRTFVPWFRHYIIPHLMNVWVIIFASSREG